MLLDRGMPLLLAKTALSESPISGGDGFLGIDDPPLGLGDPVTQSSLESSFPCLSSSDFSLVSTLVCQLASSPLGTHKGSSDGTSSVEALPLTSHSICFSHLSGVQSALNPATLLALQSVYFFDPALHSLVYKLVAKKVQSVTAPLEEEYCIVC